MSAVFTDFFCQCYTFFNMNFSIMSFDYIVSKIADGILATFRYIGDLFDTNNIVPNIGDSLDPFSGLLVDISLGFLIWPIVLFDLVLLVAVLYLGTKINRLAAEARAKVQKSFRDTGKRMQSEKKNPSWDRILSFFSTSDESSWRIGVIEADNYLDQMTEKMGYPGETLGERLKNMNPGDFPELNNAWEAHKIRNQIAHDGQNFHFSARDARHALSLFEKVFIGLGLI